MTHTEDNRMTSIYVLICRNSAGEIVIPPFSGFDEDEAQAYYEEASSEPGTPIFDCSLIKILKVFELMDGKIVWANRKPVGQGQALYLSIDFGCHDKPYLYFNHLMDETQADLGSMHVARVY